MIYSVTSTSKHIYASGGSSLPYVSYNASNPAQGMLRLNGNDMEVFDGHTWIKIYSSNSTISLNNDAEQAIDWAIKKQKQENDWYELASSNEAVRIALEQLEQARTRVELTAILAREHEQTTN